MAMRMEGSLALYVGPWKFQGHSHVLFEIPGGDSIGLCSDRTCVREWLGCTEAFLARALTGDLRSQRLFSGSPCYDMHVPFRI